MKLQLYSLLHPTLLEGVSARARGCRPVMKKKKRTGGREKEGKIPLRLRMIWDALRPAAISPIRIKSTEQLKIEEEAGKS